MKTWSNKINCLIKMAKLKKMKVAMTMEKVQKKYAM